MFNINIYAKYEVVRFIDDCYRSYDSDDPDYYKKDSFSEKFTMTGSELMNHFYKLFELNNFISITVRTKKGSLVIKLEDFDASDGTGTDYEYAIKELK